MSKIEERVCEEFSWYCHDDKIAALGVAELRQRANDGFLKYGVTLERTDLTKLQWFKHLREELLDACNYAIRLQMYNETSSCEDDLLHSLKLDLFHHLEKIYENSLFESEMSEFQ